MTAIYFIPVVFLLIYRIVFFRGGVNTFSKSGDFVFTLYAFSLLMGGVYEILFPDESTFPPSLSAVIFLTICFSIYFFPLFLFQSRKLESLNIGSLGVFRLICGFFFLGSVYAIVIFTPRVITAFSGDLHLYRVDVNLGNVNAGSLTIFDTIAVGFSTFFGIVQVLGLIVLFGNTFGKYSKFIALALICSSLSYVFNALMFAGRDGVIFWLLSLVFNLIVLKSWFSVRLGAFSWKTILVIGGGVMIPFLLISYSRFSTDTFYYLFSYISHQLTAFNDVYVLDPPLYNGDRNFREIKSLLMQSTSQLDSNEYFGYYWSYGVMPFRFKYFIGSLLTDFDAVGTFLIVTLYSLSLFFILVKKDKYSKNHSSISIDSLLFYYLYCQVGFMGVFYFKHQALNNYILALLLLIVFLKIFRTFGFRRLVKLG